jgi:hypothetical protein
VGHCSTCGRFQYLYQSTMIEFEGATFRHFACVECGGGAWCRDFSLVDGDDACAYGAHKHAEGQCRPRW